jgi:uncharacterized membrane protein YkvA (DUF1232 family)
VPVLVGQWPPIRVWTRRHLAQLNRAWAQLAGFLRVRYATVAQVGGNRLRDLQREGLVLSFIARDARVPWYSKLVALVSVGYIFSPVQLIPDWIPGIGFLDDLLVVSLGIKLALKMTPPDVLASCRERAATTLAKHTDALRIGARVVVIGVAFVWLLAAIALALLLLHALRG